MEIASDDTAHLRIGKYVYFPASRELLKVSKVRGPLTAATLSSLCINRICPVGNGGFVQDHVMASFSSQHGATKAPAQCLVHSRTLSFSKMVQTAKDAGFEGYGGVEDGVPLVGDDGSPRILENSFFGLGGFGVFASAIVPSRLGFGAQSEGSETPFSVGHWAIPSHSLGCRNMQTLLLGMDANEITSLRRQFATTYGLVGTQVARPAPGGVSPPSSQTQGIAAERGLHGYPRMEATGGFNQTSVRSMELLSLSAEHPEFGQKGIVPSHEAQVLKEVRSVGMVSNPQTAPYTGSGQRIEPNVVVSEEVQAGPSTKKPSGVTPSMPGYAATSLMLPIQPHLTTARAHTFNAPVEEALKVQPPSSVVESIEAVVAAQRAPSTSEEQITASPSAAAVTPQSASFGTAALGGEIQPGETKKPEIPAVPTSTFKKTLPAPTKNEIVIRNRISAQRSNEKRRRKIENTKKELAFLRSTYLPQLQHRKGSLLSENQHLRQEFMQRYHHQEIESFF